jgi:biopolymer transport protein ExbD
MPAIREKQMKQLTFIKNRPPSQSAEQIDLDVTPIMSMFLILLPFLVSMAVLTHISVLQFSLPPNVGTGLADTGEKPKVKLTVVVAPEYLAITGGAAMLDSLPLVDGLYPLDSLKAQLTIRKQSAQVADEIIVAVRDVVAMKHVVSVMDKCRDAGFEKIGLSSAAAGTTGGP